MNKAGDRYVKTDPWKIVEEGFHPEKGRVSESLFSLANEHMGVRGYFEEGYSGDTLVGSYVNGVYEEHFLKEPLSYRGISSRICFMVNTLNWLSVRLTADGETLDLHRADFRDFRRELDFRTGMLCREFVWRTASGKEMKLCFDRFLSMTANELGAQRIRMTALNFSGDVSLTFGMDFGVVHECYRESFWDCPRAEASHTTRRILGISKNMKQVVFGGFRVTPEVGQRVPLRADTFVGTRYTLELRREVPVTLDRLCVVSTPRAPGASPEEAWTQGNEALTALDGWTFDGALEANRKHWGQVWETRDIVIEGDPPAQQGIRFCIFQLEQTSRGALPGMNIGAKGLSGEAYNGNAFWDTEIYCLPYYLFTNPAAAKQLLQFRHRTLAQALSRARDLDCAGACFPVATIDGTESCTLWQHASLQVQPTTAVAYAIRHYAAVTQDTSWLFGEGVELLVQICRYLATRGQWSGAGRGFGFYGVMGPDEFHMMVNNNCYTNLMAARSFQLALETLSALKEKHPERWSRGDCGALADSRRNGLMEVDGRPHDRPAPRRRTLRAARWLLRPSSLGRSRHSA